MVHRTYLAVHCGGLVGGADAPFPEHVAGDVLAYVVARAGASVRSRGVGVSRLRLPLGPFAGSALLRLTATGCQEMAGVVIPAALALLALPCRCYS